MTSQFSSGKDLAQSRTSVTHLRRKAVEHVVEIFGGNRLDDAAGLRVFRYHPALEETNKPLCLSDGFINVNRAHV